MQLTTEAHTAEAFQRRRAGILLHPTSLPGHPDNGDLGHDAYRFIEFLSASGISMWQMLPLGPTHEDGSPYQCLSAHAGNPRLISLDWLQDRGWLKLSDVHLEEHDRRFRGACLIAAWETFSKQADDAHKQSYAQFCQEHAWLDDYALYLAIRHEQQGQAWNQWTVELRDRDPAALRAAQKRLAETLDQIRFEQYVFFTQWHELKDYAHEHGIWLFGDMPIFVAHDSADVWCHREYFTLDETGQPQIVAGVPPDYFSETGQRWGNPLYRWERMQADGFKWWLERVQSQLDLFDVVRIDHFRGFEAYWEIPAEEETAIGGYWVKAPGEELLQALYERFAGLPLVAEDLGVITPEVDALRCKFKLPGMKILQFAFGSGPDNPYLPHNHEHNCVVYTGTHDNDTTLSWFEALPPELQDEIEAYLGYSISDSMPWPLIRLAFASVAWLAVVPLQDVLSLGKGERMNTPGTTEGNWSWRFNWKQVTPKIAPRLLELAQRYGRAPQ